MPVNEKPKIHENIVCANVFIKKGHKYLLIKRSPKKKFAPNYVHPFGGKIDKDENPYLAAKREILEETGLEVKDMKLEAVILEIMPHPDKIPCNWLIFHFLAKYKSGELKVNEEGKAVWMKKKEILKEKNLFPSVKRLINNILNPKDGTVFATFEYDDRCEIVETTEKVDVCAV